MFSQACVILFTRRGIGLPLERGGFAFGGNSAFKRRGSAFEGRKVCLWREGRLPSERDLPLKGGGLSFEGGGSTFGGKGVCLWRGSEFEGRGFYQPAASMHPTGMHSCLAGKKENKILLIQSFTKIQGGHIFTKIKFPVFSLCSINFPCVLLCKS